MYRANLKKILTPVERSLLSGLKTGRAVQDYLDTLPINFENSGETYMSVRRVLHEKTAHCLEGALVAAAAFVINGQSPLILDFQTTPEDEDHVVTLFKEHGYWGAVSKTNHAVLRYRDPVYKTVRELAMSYFHEYFTWAGVKSLRAYSRPFDLSRFAPERWISAEEELHWLAEAIDSSPHVPIIQPRHVHSLRKASKLELDTLRLVEWKNPSDTTCKKDSN